MLSNEQRKAFFRLVRRLKKEHPIGNVTVRFFDSTALGDSEADCSRTPKWFVIRIGKHLNAVNAHYALCEEWAHALVWDKIATDELFEQDLPYNKLSRKLHCREWALSYMKAINTRVDMLCEQAK